MKPSYNGFEAKKANNFAELPPVGAYVTEILNVEFIDHNDKEKNPFNDPHDKIALYLDITEGEYKGRFMEVWQSQKERFGESATYKGMFRLTPPIDGDEDWRKRSFESNLWCVQESNPGYAWDWDEKKLKGKKVGINLRKRLYNYTNQNGEVETRDTVEIGKFETIADVKAGKCRLMRENDRRQNKDTAPASTDGSEFTDVSKAVDVPW